MNNTLQANQVKTSSKDFLLGILPYLHYETGEWVMVKCFDKVNYIYMQYKANDHS